MLNEGGYQLALAVANVSTVASFRLAFLTKC